MNVNSFIATIREVVQQELQKFKKSVAYGTIPGTYSSGRPTVQFDGEATVSTKTYPYLSSYTPVANHRVMLIRDADGTWTVVGRVI